jgi:hypothetical protein
VQTAANEDAISAAVERDLSRSSHGIIWKWDQPNRGSSEYFMMISCIPVTTREACICFQTIILYGCTFANVYNINTLWMSSLYIAFDGQKKNVLCVRACSISTTVTSGKGLILMLPANIDISPFQHQCLGRNCWGHCHGDLSTT